MSDRLATYLFAAALLVCATFAHGQGLRWDLGAPGSAGAVTTSGSGGLPSLLAQPGVALQWCNHPANANPCTNFATTYTSITLGTPCATDHPIVLQGANTCLATGDNLGNMGVWVAANTACSGILCYDYTLTLNGVALGGPYVWTSAAGGGGSTQGPFPLQNCVADQSGATFVNTTALSNYFYSHYEFMYNPTSISAAFPIYFNCTLKLPHILPSGTARIVLDSVSTNDGTAGHTMTFATCDTTVNTTVNVGSLTCASTRVFTTTAIAYGWTTFSFDVQTTLAADALLVVQIKATAESGLATNVLASGFYLEWQ